jgi:hypothetical protein
LPRITTTSSSINNNLPASTSSMGLTLSHNCRGVPGGFILSLPWSDALCPLGLLTLILALTLTLCGSRLPLSLCLPLWLRLYTYRRHATTVRRALKCGSLSQSLPLGMWLYTCRRHATTVRRLVKGGVGSSYRRRRWSRVWTEVGSVGGCWRGRLVCWRGVVHDPWLGMLRSGVIRRCM